MLVVFQLIPPVTGQASIDLATLCECTEDISSEKLRRSQIRENLMWGGCSDTKIYKVHLISKLNVDFNKQSPQVYLKTFIQTWITKHDLEGEPLPGINGLITPINLGWFLTQPWSSHLSTKPRSRDKSTKLWTTSASGSMGVSGDKGPRCVPLRLLRLIDAVPVGEIVSGKSSQKLSRPNLQQMDLNRGKNWMIQTQLIPKTVKSFLKNHPKWPESFHGSTVDREKWENISSDGSLHSRFP